MYISERVFKENMKMKHAFYKNLPIIFMFILSYCIGFIPILIPPFSVFFIISQVILWCFIAIISVKRNISCDYLCFYRFIITLIGLVYFIFDVNALENQENMRLLLITQIFPVFESYLGVYLVGTMALTIVPVFIINFIYDAMIVIIFYISKNKYKSKTVGNAENNKAKSTENSTN